MYCNVCPQVISLCNPIGFASLLEASRYSDLSLLFRLFSKFKDGVPSIRSGFGEYIKVLLIYCKSLKSLSLRNVLSD